jgi:hypothetical protein
MRDGEIADPVAWLKPSIRYHLLRTLRAEGYAIWIKDGSGILGRALVTWWTS